MVIDGLMEILFRKAFDRDGEIAASGTVLQPVLAEVMRSAYFRRRPPKTAGREEFGREYVKSFLRRCGRARPRDVIATATALTAHSITDALRRFVLNRGVYQDFVVSGGGTENPTLLAMLANCLRPLGLQVRLSDEFGIPSEAKEAVAFALLAYQTWNRQSSNIPSATGAKRSVILGKVSYV
jgi:anhydro-N-acetylmuramic acid kinase